MHDNYRPPDPSVRHEPPRPPPEVDATMGGSHRPPPPVGQPEFIPMRETSETFDNKNVRTRVRKKTKEHNATASRQAEIIKAQVAKMKEQFDHVMARGSKDCLLYTSPSPRD